MSIETAEAVAAEVTVGGGPVGDPPPVMKPREIARRRGNSLQKWALVAIWIVLIAVFGALMPQSFLSAQNFQSLLGSQAILVILTLGLVLPLTTGDYDLSAGAVLSLSAMTIAVLNAQHGWPIWLAVLAALLFGVVVGVINAVVTVLVGIDSLIVTLGMGSIGTGVVLWIGNSQTISGVADALVQAVVGTRLLGIPIAFYYGLLCCIVVWYLFEHTSLGRRMLFTGRGPRVARLSGVNVTRIRFGSLVASSFLAAVAGVLYVGTSSAANPGAGEPMVLPAMAAAFLGTTAIRPGRFNAWGTIVAVYFLSTGITGLALLGIPSFVQNLFYGGTLVLAVVLAKLARRRYVRDDAS
jgi:ribose transport system permease protein